MNTHEKLTKQIWYRRPAENWQEALPIGNGRLGAMVYGGVNCDTLALNEDSIWGGYPQDYHNSLAKEALPEIRRLLFAGKNREAELLAERTMLSNPRRVFPYQPLGEMVIEHRTSRCYKNYRRYLDLENAVAVTDYQMEDVEYHKEYFVSFPDQVMAVRYQSAKEGAFSLIMSLERKQNAQVRRLDHNTVLMEGFCHEKGIHFACGVRVVTEGGRVNGKPRKEAVTEIYGADGVTFYLAAATTFRSTDPGRTVRETLDAAERKGYERLKKDHVEDYRSLFDRFAFRLEDFTESKMELDTAERVENLRAGKEDLQIFPLYTNYQRYLLISSSRPGSLPSNLQGIWNHRMCPPWDCDFHGNVNWQINYWPAEAYNLAECHEPLFDFLERVMENGRKTAEKIYGAGGWVMHHCTDIWGTTAPTTGLWGLWPMAGLWCCRDIYEYYLYTGKEDFLREKYPILRGAVEFALDFLVEAPQETGWGGYLVTNPSHSPENQFRAEDGSASWLTWACTMDLEILNDLFDICVKVIDLLGTEEKRTYDQSEGEKEGFDSQLRSRILTAMDRLPPIQISQRTGCIQEWIKDYEEIWPEHRHVSHLYGCYPGHMITPQNTPKLSQAAKESLWRRYRSGYDSQGWSMGWIACIWARLWEAEEACRSLETIVRKHMMYNLFIDAHGNPQVGDAQAVPAAILDMLAQSHDGCIRLLPALPEKWEKGSLRGMRLRGGYELSMEWEEGRLLRAELVADRVDGDIPVFLPEQENYVIYREKNISQIWHK